MQKTHVALVCVVDLLKIGYALAIRAFVLCTLLHVILDSDAHMVMLNIKLYDSNSQLTIHDVVKDEQELLMHDHCWKVELEMLVPRPMILSIWFCTGVSDFCELMLFFCLTKILFIFEERVMGRAG